MSSRFVLEGLLKEAEKLQDKFTMCVFNGLIETYDFERDVNSVDSGFEILQNALILAIADCED